MVDLARHGVIAMEPSPANSADVQVAQRSAGGTLTRFEQEVVRGLLGSRPAPGTAVRLWEVSSRFAAATPEIRRRLYAELVDRGYFLRSPEETREVWRDRSLIAFFLILLVGGVAGLVWADGLPFYWFLLASLALLALAVYLVSGALSRKTATGAEATAKWRAFRRYLADIARYEQLEEAEAIFDRYLPFAVAFGLERSWVETFARAGAAVPLWFAPLPTAAGDHGPPSTERPWWRGDGEGEPFDRRGDSWWDIAGSEDAADQRRDDPVGEREEGRFHLPNLPDWQGTSDHAGRSLQGASNGLLSMFQSAGGALADFAEAAASDSDDSGGSSVGWRSSSSRSSSSGSSSSRSSFSGGGSSGGSSGGGSRGFG